MQAATTSAPNAIARRLMAIAALTVATLFLLAGGAIYFASQTGQTAQAVHGHVLSTLVGVWELELLLERHRRVVESAPLEFDRAQLRKDRRTAQATQERMLALVAAGDGEFARNARPVLADVFKRGASVLALAEEFAQQKGLDAVDSYTAAATALASMIRAHRAEQLQFVEQELQGVGRSGRQLINWVVFVALAALGVIGPLCLVLVRRIASRLAAISEAIAKLARNETDVDAGDVAARDEIGRMARAVVVLKANAVTLLEQKARLEKLNLWLDIALNNMARGLSMFDAERRLVVCNAVYARMYDLPGELTQPGTSFDNILVRRLAMLKPDRSEGGETAFDQLVSRKISGREEGAFTQELSDGRIIEVSVTPLAAGGWVAMHEDITERRRTAERITRMARHDSLTGLANRLSFRESLEKAVADIGAGGFAVQCIDLDKFKDVNDTHGHPMGDALLKAVAERLTATARRDDCVARLGGDEFAIIQRGVVDDGDARAMGTRLIQALSRPYQIHGQRIEIGATIGIALALEAGANCDELMRNADMALYRAKGDGRGRLSFYHPALEGRLRARRALEADLHNAVAAGQLELFYQPIIDLALGEVTGCEALLRWRHPERGLVPPVEFIPVAEETGLIVGIGQWALEEATRAATRWPGGVKVAVNLSPAQIGECDLAAIAEGALAASGLAAERLILEVTESVLLDDDPQQIEVLHKLRKCGIAIALDDFGTGYSSLSYLRAFPFDKIRIDQSFVRDLPLRRDCAAIVGAVTQLARSLDMWTVAEGVETEEHLAMVRAAGCSEAQGYLFSRPVPESEILDVIADCNRRLNHRPGPQAGAPTAA